MICGPFICCYNIKYNFNLNKFFKENFTLKWFTYSRQKPSLRFIVLFPNKHFCSIPTVVTEFIIKKYIHLPQFLWAHLKIQSLSHHNHLLHRRQSHPHHQLGLNQQTPSLQSESRQKTPDPHGATWFSEVPMFRFLVPTKRNLYEKFTLGTICSKTNHQWKICKNHFVIIQCKHQKWKEVTTSWHEWF